MKRLLLIVPLGMIVVISALLAIRANQQRSASIALVHAECDLTYRTECLTGVHDPRLKSLLFHLTNTLTSVTMGDEELLDSIIPQLEKIDTVNNVAIEWSGGCGLCRVPASNARERLLKRFPDLTIELIHLAVAPVVG